MKARRKIIIHGRKMKTSKKNLRLIAFLEKWFSEPDDKGEEFWDEFIKDMEKNKFNIPEKENDNVT